MSTKTWDVIIAGAGPVGLFLACELRLARTDLSVLLVERDADPSINTTPWKVAPLGVRGINTLSVESFYRRGLLEQVMTDNQFFQRTDEFNSKGGHAGHFAGMMFDSTKVDTSAPCWKYKLPGPALCPAPSSLEKVGTTLYKRAIELGVEIRGGVEVTGVDEDEGEDGEVTLHAAGDQSFRAKWLVGCDGGRSKVRKAVGFDFVGTEPELMGYTILCDLDDPQKSFQRGFHRTTTGLYITMFPGHIGFMEPIANGPSDRAAELTKDDLEVVMRRITGFEDVGIKDLKLYSTFTDRARQATTYRKGRVLLAGDSAHIHSPLGGQGLNAGLGDAMNLGWKLAAVARGDVSPDLLDTYTSERHPVGVWVTEWTRAQVATLKPDLQARAVANLVRNLISTKDGVTCMVEQHWGLTQRYDLSGDDDNSKPLHTIIGRSVPDFEFSDGSGRLGEKMRSGRGILLSFEDGDDSAQLKSLAERWSPAVDFMSGRAVNELGFKALLVRPDGTVAWATEDGIDTEAVTSALIRWFGSRP